MSILDIAAAVCPGRKHKIISMRPGEKLHEQMISKEMQNSLLNILLIIKFYLTSITFTMMWKG